MQKPGRFELADTGTLLLDEISEMDVGLQAKLLRVLQEGEYDRVGGIKTQRCDVRIVATTNRDLREEIKKGSFREDLYYRLNVIPIVMPPLCERKGDVELLVKHFVEKYAKKNGRSVPPVSAATMKVLLAYGWPGNVRELENVVERAILLASGDELEPEDFPMVTVEPAQKKSAKVAEKKK
jgi:transcriptional regulator with GAF, ATPase, and Fis domain